MGMCRGQCVLQSRVMYTAYDRRVSNCFWHTGIGDEKFKMFFCSQKCRHGTGRCRNRRLVQRMIVAMYGYCVVIEYKIYKDA